MFRFDFWNAFSREPSYKERDRFNSKSREDIIDALIASEEALVKQDEENSDSYDKMVEKYEKRIADTARATKLAVEDTTRTHNQEMADLKHKTSTEVKELKADHELEIKRTQLETEFASDKKVTDAETRAIEAEKKLAVAEATNVILKEMVDLNGDIVDIKEMTNKIIDKLPTINLSSLPSPAPVKQEQKKKDDN